ncbi:hypothetical protein C8J57DRAFT_1252510 [Mycena rebaudengoi]|nr:hypothetical protein C8J57DRAFT_1252510 [Mycena rebaudengoi]
MNECPELQALLQAGTIAYEGETSRLRLKDGTWIRRNQGESIVAATKRLLGPQVMFGIFDDEANSVGTHQTFYMHPERAQYIDSLSDKEEEHLIEDSDTGYQTDLVEAYVETDSDDSTDEDQPLRRVYLALPRRHQGWDTEPEVNSAERTVPTTRSNRKTIFDGVQVPS